MFTYCQINNTQQTSYTMKHELLAVHLKKTSWVCIVDHVVSAGHTCNSVYVCHTHICIQHSRQDALNLSELPQGAIFLQITFSFLTVRFCAPPQTSLVQELEQKHSISCLGTAAFFIHALVFRSSKVMGQTTFIYSDENPLQTMTA